ncbi:MAG: acyl-CoA dehydrogenase family protein [Candidatus Aminicenantes bacterium]|nr:acyl-CoA dehydrogenase family protein [Candidatus Aminicenantes bacterium]
MIDFSLTEEQLALQEMAREFAANEMRPVAAKYDQSHEFAFEVMEKAFQAGFLTANIPEAYGGVGLSGLDLCVISEELSAGCAGLFTSMMACALASTPLILFGTEEQKQKFLLPLTKKMNLTAFCLTEREAGSDAGAVQTRAVRDGDDFIINGSKCFITNGGVASLYTVFANTSPNKGARGITAFIVPRETPGVIVGKVEDKMGQRASNTAEIFFEDVRVPAANMLGRQGYGFIVAMKTFDQTRASVGAASVGVARAAMEAAVAYAKTRRQFGKPIALYQATQFKIAQMAMEIQAARHLVYHAAWLADNGKPNGSESAMAKAYASDIAFAAANESIQIHGGYGYMRDYPVEKFLRDAKLFQIYEGTNEIQRMVIAHEVIGPVKE